MDFKDKAAWITGASSGIGEALARQLHAQGARLILSSNDQPGLERVGRDLPGATLLPLDLSRPETLEPAAKQAEAIHGRIDLLFNNAGISQRARVLETTIETYRRIMEIDFFGHVILTKAALPGMIERKSGHIVVTSSISGIIAAPLRSGYCAAKHALHGFFDTLRAEVYEHGVQVTIACPTAVKTDISLHALTGDGTSYGKMSGFLGEGNSAEDIARQMLDAVRKGREEVVLGRDKLRLTVYLKRFTPGLFSRILRKAKID